MKHSRRDLEYFYFTKNSIQVSKHTFKIKSFDLICNQFVVNSSHLFLPLSESELVKKIVKKFTRYR